MLVCLYVCVVNAVMHFVDIKYVNILLPYYFHMLCMYANVFILCVYSKQVYIYIYMYRDVVSHSFEYVSCTLKCNSHYPYNVCLFYHHHSFIHSFSHLSIRLCIHLSDFRFDIAASYTIYIVCSLTNLCSMPQM